MDSKWSMAGKIVLLPEPLGAPHGEKQDQARCTIQQLGGDIAYAKPPLAPWSHPGPDKSEATHEFVPEGGKSLTSLPSITEKSLSELKSLAHSEFIKFLEPHKRVCFVPRVQSTSSTTLESRYYGLPWMPQDMEWPTFEGSPMNFVLQLNTKNLPEEWSSKIKPGLLLFFHADQGSGVDDSSLILVDPSKDGALRPTPKGLKENPALTIVGWEKVSDYPWNETYRSFPGFEKFVDVSMGFGSSHAGMALGVDGNLHSEKSVLEKKMEVLPYTFECDKLGGWPRWEQGDETPHDREGQKMDFLMQVGFEGILFGLPEQTKIHWPTWGRGQIFFSTRTQEFKYVWACD